MLMLVRVRMLRVEVHIPYPWQYICWHRSLLLALVGKQLHLKIKS
jgi:hypothetical protein